MLRPPCIHPLIDTHAHLNDPGLRTELTSVLRGALDAGVTQILAIGTTVKESASILEIADEQLGVFAVVGVQPNCVAQAEPGDWAIISELARRPGVVAIGETGLDRHWDFTPFGQQQEWFDRHLALARELDFPVVIHCRDCEADIIDQLSRQGGRVRGVLHSFTGTQEHAEKFLELGLHISFAGMITFKNKKLDGLRNVAAAVPSDRLLVETDSPYLSPEPLRGRPNQPAHISWTAACLASLRGIDSIELAQQTTANARALFRLPMTETILA